MKTSAANSNESITVVTPTLRRPREVIELLENLGRQTRLPSELVLVDGAPEQEDETQNALAAIRETLAVPCRYIRRGGGTAIQRNIGIDAAQGEFIAFIDDDVRLEPDFFEKALAVFAADSMKTLGGVVGYRTNEHFTPESAQRWRWYRRLGLLKTFEPGRYDFECGYPINANMQPPFRGTRSVDFATSSCVVWRREVLSDGLRFDAFFRDFGVLEDAHFSLRASRKWRLLQCGDARCVHLASPRGRSSRRKIGYKCVVNYYFVFRNIAGPLTAGKKFRFWRFQAFELIRIATSAVRRMRVDDVLELRGRLEGFRSVLTNRILH